MLIAKCDRCSEEKNARKEKYFEIGEGKLLCDNCNKLYAQIEIKADAVRMQAIKNLGEEFWGEMIKEKVKSKAE